MPRDFDPRQHPRWPAGAPDDPEGDGQGGRFREAGDLAGSIVGNLHGVTTGPWHQRASDQLGQRRGEHPRQQYNARVMDAGQAQWNENRMDQFQDDDLSTRISDFNIAQAQGDVARQDQAADALRAHLQSHYPDRAAALPAAPDHRDAPRSSTRDSENWQVLSEAEQTQAQIKANNDGDPDDGLAIRIERLRREQGRTGRNVEADRAADDLRQYMADDPEGLIAAHGRAPQPQQAHVDRLMAQSRSDGEELPASEVGRLVDSGQQYELMSGPGGWLRITEHWIEPDVQGDQHVFTLEGDPNPIYMDDDSRLAVRPFGRGLPQDHPQAPTSGQISAEEREQWNTRAANDDYDARVYSTAVALLDNLDEHEDQPEYGRLQQLISTYEDARTNPGDPESIDSAADDLAGELADYDIYFDPPTRPDYDRFPHITAGGTPPPPGPTGPDFGTPRDDEQASRARGLANVVQSSPPGTVWLQDNQGGYSPIASAHQERGDYMFVTTDGVHIARQPDQWVRYRWGEDGSLFGGAPVAAPTDDGLDRLAALDNRDLRDLAIEYGIPNVPDLWQIGPVERATLIDGIISAQAAEQNRDANPVDWTDPMQQTAGVVAGMLQALPGTRIQIQASDGSWHEVDHVFRRPGDDRIDIGYVGTNFLDLRDPDDPLTIRVDNISTRQSADALRDAGLGAGLIFERNRDLVANRRANDEYNAQVYQRAYDLLGDYPPGDPDLARIRSAMQEFRDASTNPDDPQSIDAAIDDLVDNLQDFGIHFDQAAAPVRPDYDADTVLSAGAGGVIPIPGTTQLPRRPSVQDIEPGQSLAEALAGNTGNAHRDVIPPGYRQRIHDIYDYTDRHTGLRSEVTDSNIAIMGDRLSLQGVIYDTNGNAVGRFTRNISGDTVEHAHFKIDSTDQGGGFTSRWFEQVKQQYRDNGFRYITVSANLDVGGYAWAKIGFDFDSRSDASDLLWKAKNTARVKQTIGELSDETVAEIQALRDRFDAGEWVTPLEISRLGWRNRDADQFDGYPRTAGNGDQIEMWLGKFIMLGSSWSGKLTL